MCGPFGHLLPLSLSRTPHYPGSGGGGLTRPLHRPCPALMMSCARDQSLHGISVLVSVLIMLCIMLALSLCFASVPTHSHSVRFAAQQSFFNEFNIFTTLHPRDLTRSGRLSSVQQRSFRAIYICLNWKPNSVHCNELQAESSGKAVSLCINMLNAQMNPRGFTQVR